MPEAPKFTAGLSISISISCMTVPLWLARFWPTSSSNTGQFILGTDKLCRFSRWVPCWLSPQIFQNSALVPV